MRFALPILLSLTLLTLPACDKPQQAPASANDRVRLADEAFYIGPPSRFKLPGVYDDFLESHGVFIISDHGMVVALSAVSPNSNATVRYDETLLQFVDPRDGTRYSKDGLALGLPKPRPSLNRCRIALSIAFANRPRELLVDPTYLYNHQDDLWSDFNTAYEFEDDERPTGDYTAQQRATRR